MVSVNFGIQFQRICMRKKQLSRNLDKFRLIGQRSTLLKSFRYMDLSISNKVLPSNGDVQTYKKLTIESSHSKKLAHERLLLDLIELIIRNRTLPFWTDVFSNTRYV